MTFNDEMLIKAIKNELEDVIQSVMQDESYWATMPDKSPDFVDAIVAKVLSGELVVSVKVRKTGDTDTSDGETEDDSNSNSGGYTYNLPSAG